MMPVFTLFRMAVRKVKHKPCFRLNLGNQDREISLNKNSKVQNLIINI